MTVTYNETYTDGATDLSAGSTWAANAKVLVTDQSQTIDTNLDVSANAIDLVHFIGGGARIRTAAGGGATYTIDNTYTTDPNAVWVGGGYQKWNFATNAVPEMIIDGGEHVIASGTATFLAVFSGKVTIEAGATVTGMAIHGGLVRAFSAIATMHQSGGRLEAEARIGSTAYYLAGGVGQILNTSGSACTLLELGAGATLIPRAGDYATVNRRGGRIAYSGAERSLIMGSTAFTNYGGASPADTGMIDIQNLTDYSAYSSGGGAVPLP
jgi:hypothetical protein